MRRSIDRRDEFGQGWTSGYGLDRQERVGRRASLGGRVSPMRTSRRDRDLQAQGRRRRLGRHDRGGAPKRQAPSVPPGPRADRRRPVRPLRLDVLPSCPRGGPSGPASSAGGKRRNRRAPRRRPPPPRQDHQCRAKLARGEGISKKPLGPGTQVRYLAVLKHVLAKAKDEWEWINDDPAARARGPKEPRGRVRYLSGEERKALSQLAEKARNGAFTPWSSWPSGLVLGRGSFSACAGRMWTWCAGRPPSLGHTPHGRGARAGKGSVIRSLWPVCLPGSGPGLAGSRGIIAFPATLGIKPCASRE